MRSFRFPVSLLFVLSLALLPACKVVQPGEVGVQTFMGSMKDRTLSEGVSVPNINNVTRVSTRAQSMTVGGETGAAVTSDMQSVGFRVNLSYYVPDGEAAKALFRYVSRDPSSWRNIILAPAVSQSVKTVFSTYTLRGLVENREQVRREVAEQINEVVAERLVERSDELENTLIVTQVVLENLEYSREFAQAIEATVRAEQRVREERNELERVRIQMEQRVVQAEMERRAAVERARGEAESILIRAEADVQAYMAYGAAGLNPNTLRFTEVWDGVLPSVLSGEGMEFLTRPSTPGRAGSVEVILEGIRAARHELAPVPERSLSDEVVPIEELMAPPAGE
ncbi:MAG: prohibitin family protein [Deltaproteobacteria bacterium]|nr:MAG: prohibitin family protein [Deltaproteobacteria bacterium]